MIEWIALGTGLLAIGADIAKRKIKYAISNYPSYTVSGPLVSVIIITYNEEAYLPDTLAGVMHQTYSNLEIIVVDNKSTDNTIKIAEEAKVILCDNPEYNLSRSRNIGAQKASGDIFIFLDADTIPEQTAVEKIVEAINNGAAMVHINRCCTDSTFQGTLRVAGGWLPEIAGQHTSYNGSFIAVTRQAYEDVGGFDETCLPQEGCGEDVEFIRSVHDRYPSAILRNVYAGTSARRQKEEGYLVSQHWQSRAIRQMIV